MNKTSSKKVLPTCNDTRECGMSKFVLREKKCTCLDSTYPDGACPFCKPERSVTNGVYYPHKDYSARGIMKVV